MTRIPLRLASALPFLTAILFRLASALAFLTAIFAFHRRALARQAPPSTSGQTALAPHPRVPNAEPGPQKQQDTEVQVEPTDERVTAAYKKQVQTYLRLTEVQTYLRLRGCKLGYFLNFGEALRRTGITRCVNGLEECSPLCVSAPLRENKPGIPTNPSTRPRTSA